MQSQYAREVQEYNDSLIKAGMYSAGYTGNDLIDLISTTWFAAVELSCYQLDTIDSDTFISFMLKAVEDLNALKVFLKDHNIDSIYGTDSGKRRDIYSSSYNGKNLKGLFNAAWNACHDLAHFRQENTPEEQDYFLKMEPRICAIRNFVYGHQLDSVSKCYTPDNSDIDGREFL